MMNAENKMDADKSTTQTGDADIGSTVARIFKKFDPPKLHLSVSPHVRSRLSVQKIMFAVIIALMPAFISSIILFGVKAITLVATCVASTIFAEYIANLMLKKRQSIGDLSAIITGMLLAFNLPPALPLWMAAIGSVFAIAVAKMAFGGLGGNFINPALAGRAFLVASYPAAMTNFTPTVFGGMSGLSSEVLSTDAVSEATSAAVSSIDAISSASPLKAIKLAFADGSYSASDFAVALKSLFYGNVGGCIGETSAMALLIGGIFLMSIRVIGASIPLTYISTVFLLTWLTNGSGSHFTVDALIAPTFHVLGGGLILGAFFMATDPVTCPITPRGRFVFGFCCGVLTFVIRKYGGYPEGVSFSILLMNLAAPLIEKYTRPTIYGEVKIRG